MSHVDIHELAAQAETAITMNDLMQAAVDEGSSDLHIRVGRPPVLRCSGALEPLDCPDFTPADTAKMVCEIATEEQIAEVEKNGGADFGLAFSEAARFRVSIFKERHNYGLVLRQIPSTILTLEQLGLPEAVHELLYKPRGLILVTGPTGSGKSTTLASMINIINHDRDCHIITIEDPIEFYHYSKKSLVTQREVGADVPSFAEAIRRALRQDPDVILVGEMRDLETISAAISAAETGHLVFGTLHTTGAASTVDRIIDSFPTNQQEQVRTQLSMSLVAVISQVLLPRADKGGKGRCAAFEIMMSTPSIRSRIRDNKTFQISSDIQTGAKYGMVQLDTSLLNLYAEGKISYEDLVTKAQDPETTVQKLKEMMGE
ncbi:MAG: type IV pilus twitching motility protein PilT [bacterium]|nr:type IV pilus twitching motility protein PilT [bacterium]